MEPLEIRCNLSVVDPLADAMAEPVVVPCDVVETGFSAPIPVSAERVRDAVLDVKSADGSSEAIGPDYADLDRIYPTD